MNRLLTKLHYLPFQLMRVMETSGQVMSQLRKVVDIASGLVK